MKLFSTLSLLIVFCSAFGQSSDCAKFRIGKYKMEDPKTGINFITRNDSIQIEYVPKLEVKVKLNVIWTDDCTMELSLKEILENPKKLSISDFVLISEIIESKDSSYIMRSTVGNSEIVLTREFFKVE
ncbi:hypothetical protein [Aureibaculum conchae]|uniref:hypothetical protein n=1 Tax=Aureibaculum sp. 2308TA14-22 TaxID=3108392 RepID=UPI003392EC59